MFEKSCNWSIILRIFMGNGECFDFNHSSMCVCSTLYIMRLLGWVYRLSLLSCYKSTQKKIYQMIPNPCPLAYILISVSHPPHIPFLDICKNNTMAITFLVQMRQSDWYGIVRNDEIIKFHMGSGAGIWASIPCLL